MSTQMTLARGSAGAFEHNRMVMLFSMMDGSREVGCAISSSAMDDMERVSRTKPDEREQQFLPGIRLRHSVGFWLRDATTGP